MRYLGILLVIAVVVYSVTDIVNAPEEDLQGLPRGIWIIIVVLFPLLGSIAWFVIRHNARKHRPVTGGAGAGPATRRQGPLAPDDDPEFLWRLEQERRRRAGEGDPRPGTTPPPAEDDETR